jgi:peptidoglycan/LPS O-acetylase OafA/YrhL
LGLSSDPKQIPSLSGLRAFASLAVVFTHVTAIAVPGKLAVTLFFVLSGYLITTRLSTELAATGVIRIWEFYVRRARRLLPAYYVWLAAVIVLLPHRITMETGAAALYLSDYFNAWIKRGIISHTWSLSVEEHFYLLWPVVLLKWSNTRYFRRVLFGVFIAVQVARLVFGAAHPIYFYYSFEARVDALLIGCALALWAKNGGGVPALLPALLRARLAWLLPVSGLALCMFMREAVLSSVGDTLAAWCSALLIAQVVEAPPRILNNRVTDYLGALSYSLYLYHILVRWAYVVIVPGSNGGYSVHGFTNQVAVTLLSIGAAALSYRYVERPFLAGKRGRPWRSVLTPQAATQ